MNYYLDVDGTIVTTDHKEAFQLNLFLKHMFLTGDVFWLTTHCRDGNLNSVLSYLKPILSEENFTLIRQIKPTAWNTLKTEVIDFSNSFTWFDDYLIEIEKNVLIKNNCFFNWVQIDLKGNGDDILEASNLHNVALQINS